MSEKALAAAVILQAVEDFQKPEPPKFTKNGENNSAWSEWRRNRDEARSFLMDETGEWAQSRERWCNLAEIEPSRVRAEALKSFPRAA